MNKTLLTGNCRLCIRCETQSKLWTMQYEHGGDRAYSEVLDAREVAIGYALRWEATYDSSSVRLIDYCTASAFAANTKSLSVNPLILWVQIVTLTLPHVRTMSG